MLRLGAFTSLALIALYAGCSSSDDAASPPVATTDAGIDAAIASQTPASLPALADAPTTVDRTFVPHAAIATDPKAVGNPSLPNVLVDVLGRGWGDLDQAPGDPYITRTIDNSTPPLPGPNAKRLLRFAHMTDLQIADDESPARFATVDTPDLTSGAMRPSDAYLCRMANATVRTINALHRKDPMAFTLTGGDNADNAQSNEIEWVLGMLSGSPNVKCDSGDVTNMMSGDGNDGKDAFVAEGLAMPWRWVTGNHDVLVSGNYAVGPVLGAAVLGTDSQFGTRNYAADPNGAVQTGNFVIADPKRPLLDRTALMARVAADKDGHGLGDAQKTSGRATYSFDPDGTPLRFVVIDTAHESGGSEGVITQRQIDSDIKPLLDKAKADGKWVVLASHHSAQNLGDGTGPGGFKEPDPLDQTAWVNFLGNYDNVLFSIVGHSHRHRVTSYASALGDKHAFWEVMTSAIADWPHQFRVVEIFDQDNGWLMLRGTCVDFSVDGDPVAAEGKRRGTADYVGGWTESSLDVEATDKNVELWIKKP